MSNQRSAKQLVMDVIPELDDATCAVLIVEHGDGSISWHGTSTSLSRRLGLLRYVSVLTEQSITQQPDILDEVKVVERVH